MAERISLLDEIKKGGYEASIITTFNAYLPFYEEVVLRKLQSNGVRHNIVLMDAAQCAESINNNPPHLAGRSYSLIPIRSSGAFHPKVILLVGRSKGALLIGSHNLTLAGFGYNRELTNLIRVAGKDDQENMALCHTAWQHILNWVEAEQFAVPPQLKELVLKLKDFAPWLEEAPQLIPENTTIISTSVDSNSLWTSLMDHIEGVVKEVTITGAFFDARLDFIRTIKKDLNPKAINIIIDPETVQIPDQVKEKGIKYVNAKNLGSFSSKDEASGYLHAKAIGIVADKDDFYLVSGSANPSSPAWLEEGLAGNVEIMVLRKGQEAIEAAKDLGLYDLKNYSALSESDWELTKQNWRKDRAEHKTSETGQIGVAIATDSYINFKFPNNERVKTLPCTLLDKIKSDVVSVESYQNGEHYSVKVDSDLLVSASYLQVEHKGAKKFYLIHHQRQIEEHSRTGSQRLLRKALASLVTDSPDLETLIQCVDKIIFAKAKEVDRAAESIRSVQPSDSKKGQLEKVPSELSIDVSQTKKAIKKYRMRYTDNLAYLIDTLIYHLRIDREEAVEMALEFTDAKGRSEEEQIDADDEEHDDDVVSINDIEEQILATCHSKVRTLVGRIIGQLKALEEEKVFFEDVLIRLTGVLAVLRQLRNCDGKVPWVKQGQTTFPKEERSRLLEEIVQGVFEQPNSILHPPEDFQDMDELARLKGLILWLAWDSGLQLVEKKAFRESVEERDDRLKAKAIMVILAQLIEDDDVVSEEARSSIGPLCSSDMDWLNWILDAKKVIKNFVRSDITSTTDAKFGPGDVAFIKTRPELGVRLLLSVEGDKASLSFLGRNKDYLKYTLDSLKFASWDQVMPL